MLKMFASVMMMTIAASVMRVEGFTLAEILRSTTACSLFQDAGLTDLLTEDGPVSLFLPTDTVLYGYLLRHGSSFSQLRQNKEELRALLQYHVVSGMYAPSDLYNEQKLQAVNGGTIRVNTYGTDRITTQGVELQLRNYTTSNGIVYFLDGVMEPANGTVADIIAGQSDLSTLLAAAKAAGLVDFLADQNPITVFAPTDAAFSALGDTVQTLLSKPDLLAQILYYHVVPGTLYKAGLHESYLHTFREADRLHITSHFGVAIENGYILPDGEDMSAVNGVVHKMDHVLIPNSLKSQI